MKHNKLMLPVLAVIAGAAASAFTAPHNSSKPYDTADYWYEYNENQPQTKEERMKNVNYINPQTTSFTCSGSTNECAVQATVTLDSLGNPPEHPDFTGASFDGDGFPQENSGLIQANEKKSQ